jgi:hypothetical protein
MGGVVRDEQPDRKPLPILVTVLGIVEDVIRDEQSYRKSLPILVTVHVITSIPMMSFLKTVTFLSTSSQEYSSTLLSSPHITSQSASVFPK